MRVVNSIVFSILIAAQVSLQDILKPDPESFHGLHRRGTTSLLEPRHHPNILERRDVAPSPQCPESIGANPIFCDAGECGKEDPEKKGQCARMNCKCDGSKDAPKPSLTTVTAVEAGKTATGVYVLQTIKSYESLREGVTTTVETTTTAKDGKTGVETAAAVILAGGVSWFLAGMTGDAAAAEAALEAPKSDPKHENDKKCPNPQKKCSECGGKDGPICTSGSEANCACEPSKCPTGEKQPKCADPKCKGNDDDKCTVENKDCECKPDEKDECPKDEDILTCEECGGKKGEPEGPYGLFKCKGLEEKNKKWEDCECKELGEPPKPYQPMKGVDQAALLASWKGLKDITDDSYKKDPLDKDPDCKKLGWGAPQGDDDAKKDQTSVKTAIEDWCGEMDGKTLKKDDVLFKDWPIGFWKYWLSVRFLKDAKDAACKDERKVTKDECIKTLTDGIEYCDPKGDTHGVSLSGKCLDYGIDLAPENPDNRPPWDPIPKEATPKCDSHYSKVDERFFSGLYPAFCKEVDKDKKKELKKTLTNKDYVKASGKMARWLDPRSPPVEAGMFDDFKFKFEWTGEKEGEECNRDCTKAFEMIASGPCGNAGMTYTASASVGCGTYTYTIDADYRLCGVDDSLLDDNSKLVPWNKPNAEKAIKEFCSSDYDVDPAQKQPPSDFAQDTRKTKVPFQTYRYPAGSTEGVTTIWVGFVEDNDEWCFEQTKFTIKDYQGDCERLLGKVLADPDACKGDTGGTVREQGGKHGCVNWTMFQWSSKT